MSLYALPTKVGYVSAREVCDLLSQVKANLRVESRTQEDLYNHLVASLPNSAKSIERELKLNPRDRVDIWVDGIVVEVKLAPANKLAVYKQVKRYAEHPRVEAVILATNIMMALPSLIEGKPAFVVSLGRAWML